MPTVPQQVLVLIETFDRNLDDYLRADFNEANLRIQFVNPLFKTLGWDMDNTLGHAEAYKDVIHEASLKIGAQSPRPNLSP